MHNQEDTLLNCCIIPIHYGYVYSSYTCEGMFLYIYLMVYFYIVTIFCLWDSQSELKDTVVW